MKKVVDMMVKVVYWLVVLFASSVLERAFVRGCAQVGVGQMILVFAPVVIGLAGFFTAVWFGIKEEEDEA